jgi:carbon-monoxide dehydrogenase medium subunit
LTPSAFRYARPASVHEAVALLGAHGAGALVLAGGQSLIPLLVQRAVRARLVIDINRIPDLDRIEIEPEHIRMGALVRQEQARLSAVVREEVCGLSEALDWVANPVIRERGTVVGNLVANAPGSELPSVAIALQASFAVRDRAGERLVPAAELLGAGGRLAADALVTHVLWPRARGFGGFYEVARRDGHAPVVGAMVNVGREDCRVGLCGVVTVGIACPSVARAVLTRFPDAPEPHEIERLLDMDVDYACSKPLIGKRCGDAFVGAQYRRDVAPTVIQRAVMAAARTSRGSTVMAAAGARHG